VCFFCRLCKENTFVKSENISEIYEQYISVRKYIFAVFFRTNFLL